MTEQRIKTEITADTIVTGAEFRDFYLNHWPKDWYLEDMPYEVEDENGNWVLDDTAQRPLDWFGYARWQGPSGKGHESNEFKPLHELYAEVMGAQPDEVLVSIKIHPDKVNELAAAAKAIGGRVI